MPVMVTGAAGFVGLALAEHLLARGDPVVAVDRDPLPARAERDFSRLPGRLLAAERLDVRDAAAFAALVARHRPRALVHLAALTPLGPVPPALAIRTVEVNVLGVLHALAAVEAAGTPFLLVASSGSVFGGAAFDAPLLDHSVRPDPRSPYGTAKFAGERMALLVAAEAGLPLAVVRLSSIYGRWERATPARPLPSPIVRLTEAALAGAEAVVGETVQRDYLYSADVAAGLASLADHGRAVAEPLHLSTEARFSLPEWCAGLAERLPGFRWRVDPADPAAIGGSNARAPLSTRELAALTGFRARFDRAAALADYLAWWQAG